MKKVKVDVPGIQDKNAYLQFRDVGTQLNSLVRMIAENRVVLQSPDGHYWQIDVDNAGTLTTTDLGTVLP